MRWRLLIEEYGADLTYIKGENNIVADTLSRLELLPSTSEESHHHGTLLQLFTGDTIKDMRENRTKIYPLRLRDIDKAQQNDTDLLNALQRDNTDFHLKDFRGGGKPLTLICKDNRIVVPKILQQQIAQWYHVNLMHPGITRTHAHVSRANVINAQLRNGDMYHLKQQNITPGIWYA